MDGSLWARMAAGASVSMSSHKAREKLPGGVSRIVSLVRVWGGNLVARRFSQYNTVVTMARKKKGGSAADAERWRQISEGDTERGKAYPLMEIEDYYAQGR